MNTNRMQILARRVIFQMLADRRTLVMMTFIPMILLSFMGVLIRHEPGGLVIGVVQDDAGATMGAREVNLGEALIGVLHNFDEFEVETMTADEARDKLDESDVDAVIRVPETFTTGVIASRALTLPVEYEGSNPMISDRLNTMLERVGPQLMNTLVLLDAPIAGGTMPEVETTIDATYLHSGPEYDSLDYMAPALIGFFVFFFVFLLTCLSFLRERIAGTLERLQATPIRSHEIIIGYMLGFLVFGLLQGTVTLLFTVFVLDIHYAGNLLNIFVVEAILVALSVNVGIFLSTFAQNEFQVLQFVPLVVVTQGLLGGVVWEVKNMPEWLQPVARLMPLTYANDALRQIMIKGESLLGVWDDILILLVFVVLVIVLSSRTAGRAKI
ncbi:MAG: ABC transporter permease [Anaerolineae bacterium]|nr:ABC transporter permease [Anaerolineae bacterium]